MKLFSFFSTLFYLISSSLLYFFAYWAFDELLGGHDSWFSFEFILCAFIMAFLLIIPFNMAIFYLLALYGIYFLPDYNWIFAIIVTYRFAVFAVVMVALFLDWKKAYKQEK